MDKIPSVDLKELGNSNHQIHDELSLPRVSSDSKLEFSIENYKMRFITSIDGRLRDIEDNIYGNQGLLKDYEEKLLSESDPRNQAKIKQNICQLKEYLNSCRDEYISLMKYVIYLQADFSSVFLQDLKNEKSITGRTHEPK